MFGNREYSLIDWGKRLQIRRGRDMAKNSAAADRHIGQIECSVTQLEGLKAQMTYGGRMRDFHHSLCRAVSELERLEIITRASIQESSRGKPQLVLWLTP